jgi:hypothetical protein
MHKFITPSPIQIGSADPAPRTTMGEPSYRFRATMFTKETIYRAGADALSWGDGGAEGRLANADIRKVRTLRRSRDALWRGIESGAMCAAAAARECDRARQPKFHRRRPV